MSEFDRREIATVIVKGIEYRGWKTVEVRRDIQQPVSEATVTVSETDEPGRVAVQFAEARIEPGDPIRVMLGGKQVLDGFVNVRQVAYDKNHHGVMIQARSRTGDAVDSTVDHVRDGEFRDQTFPTIARRLLSRNGVQLRVEAPGGGPDPNRPFQEFATNPGQSVMQTVERLARQRALFLTDDPQGRLVAFRGSDGQGGDLVEGKNILKVNVIFRDDGAFHRTTVFQQQRGNDQTNMLVAAQVAAIADNPTARQGRFRFVHGEQPGNALDAADRAYGDQLDQYEKMIQGTITVQGWFAASGRLWDIRQNVMVVSPMIWPKRASMGLVISGVVWRQADGVGTTSEIHVRHPAFIGDETQGRTGAPGPGPNPTRPNPRPQAPEGWDAPGGGNPAWAGPMGG